MKLYFEVLTQPISTEDKRAASIKVVNSARSLIDNFVSDYHRVLGVMLNSRLLISLKRMITLIYVPSKKA